MFFIGFTVLMGTGMSRLEFDPDIMNQLPEDMPARLSTDRIESVFGGTDMAMILVEADDVLEEGTLRVVKKISRAVERIKGVDKVMSLFELKTIKGEDGAMLVHTAVDKIPHNLEERERVRKEIRENDLVYGSVVSHDFRVTGVIALVKNGTSDKHIVGSMQKIIDQYSSAAKLYHGGVPFNRMMKSMYTKEDMSKLMPAGLIVMLLFLYLCFRQLRGVVLPFLIVLMSVIVVMGAMPLLGWKISMVIILLPVVLIAIANDYGIHMIAKAQEDRSSDKNFSKEEIIRRMVTSLGKPVILAGITTVVGMLCLMGHILISAEQLGVLAALGIVYALFASLLFIPAVVSLLPKGRKVLGGENKAGMMERIMGFFSRLVVEKPAKIIVISLVFSLLTASGIFLIIVDADPMNNYEKGHPVVEVADVIKDNLGGFFTITVAVEGDVKNPEILKKIDSMERKFLKIEGVSHTISIARVVRQMTRALYEPGDDGYDGIPETRDAVAQLFELYSMNGDPDDFEKMVDFDFRNALINLRIDTTSTPVIKKILKEVDSIVKDNPAIKYIGGTGRIFEEVSSKVIHGQLISLGLAVVVVGLLLMLMFRSVVAGLVSALPLLMSLAILFGLMGFTGVHLNMVTALLSSIMIGVGIDYTIHFLWRYREERSMGRPYTEAARLTLMTTGRGIVFNALSVMVGFLVLLSSNFMPVKFFGFLVVVSIFACLVGAIVIIPSIVLVFKPAFLEPGTQCSEEMPESRAG